MSAAHLYAHVSCFPLFSSHYATRDLTVSDMFALAHTDWNSLDPVYIPSQRSPGDRALNNVVIAFKICSFADKPTLAALAGCTRATFFPAVRRLWLHGGPYCANVPGNGDIYDSPWVASRLEEVLGRVTSMVRLQSMPRFYRRLVPEAHKQ